MYLDNNWYGDRFILSKYCKLKDRPAFASIQHGHITIKNYKSNKPFGSRKISYSPWLVWNNKISNFAKRNKLKNIIPIGAIFLYLEKVYNFQNYKKSKGTIIFPFLSHPEERMYNDYEKIIRYLKKNFSPPYTISISKFEMKMKKKKIKNVNFINYGYRGNKYYLKNLYKSISKHENLVVTYPGSPLIYGLYLKKKVFLTKNYFLHNLKKEKKLNLNFTRKTSIEDLKNYGINTKNLNTQKNYKSIKKMIGTNFLKTPEQLKKILGWDSNLKSILAIFFSIVIDVKENIINGIGYSKLIRMGKNYLNVR